MKLKTVSNCDLQKNYFFIVNKLKQFYTQLYHAWNEIKATLLQDNETW